MLSLYSVRNIIGCGILYSLQIESWIVLQARRELRRVVLEGQTSGVHCRDAEFDTIFSFYGGFFVGYF